MMYKFSKEEVVEAIEYMNKHPEDDVFYKTQNTGREYTVSGYAIKRIYECIITKIVKPAMIYTNPGSANVQNRLKELKIKFYAK